MAGIGIPVKKIKRNSGSMMRNYWEEATREKENLDPDIDKSKTYKNIWKMGSSDMDFPALVKQYADNQRDARGRSIRSDAVVCMNAVIKPEAEYISSLPESEQIRLLDIAVDNFIELQGRERFKDGRCAIVYHFDEPGGHAHIFWLPVVYDKELQREKLSAKECCNVKWLSDVNRTLPGKVREAGFEIKDADCWDADMTPEERAALLERRKKKKNGRSSAQYKADKEKEIEQLERQVEQLQQRVSELEQQVESKSLQIGDIDSLIRDKYLQHQNISRELVRTKSRLQNQREYFDLANKLDDLLDNAVKAMRFFMEDREKYTPLLDAMLTILYKVFTDDLRDLMAYEIQKPVPEPERRSQPLLERLRDASERSARGSEKIVRKAAEIEEPVL